MKASSSFTATALAPLMAQSTWMARAGLALRLQVQTPRIMSLHMAAQAVAAALVPQVTSAAMVAPLLSTAAVEALAFAFGVRPVFTMEGGSIGAVVTMQEKLGLPIAFMGLSLPEDGFHGPDESFAWRQVEGGVKAFVKYFELLA